MSTTIARKGTGADTGNPGHFAATENRRSNVLLHEPVSTRELPAGAERIPNPAPGQQLVTGGDAPSTFAGAWEQVFAPLTAREAELGRRLDTPGKERDRVLLSEVGLDPDDLDGYTGTGTAYDEDGPILGVIFDGPMDEAQVARFAKYPTCIRIEQDAHSRHNEDDDDEEVRPVVRFRLPIGAGDRAEQAGQAAAPFSELLELRRKTEDAPWQILTPAPDVDEEQPARQAELAAAEAAFGPYRGINNFGTTFDAKGPLAEEARRITYAIADYKRETTPVLRKKTREDAERVKGWHIDAYERHRRTVAEVAAVEARLGGPLPEAIREPALDKDRFRHDRYRDAIVEGPARLQEILEARNTAAAALEQAKTAYREAGNRHRSAARWGAGWPEGASKAPTRPEWTGEPLRQGW